MNENLNKAEKNHNTEKRLDKIEVQLGKHEEQIAGLKEDLERHNNSIKSVEDKIDQIIIDLTELKNTKIVKKNTAISLREWMLFALLVVSTVIKYFLL